MSSIQVTEWAQFTPDQPRKRRAELVCTVCHAKKTKCDLNARVARGESQCTYCANTTRHCEPRKGKRAENKQKTYSAKCAEASNSPRRRASHLDRISEQYQDEIVVQTQTPRRQQRELQQSAQIHLPADDTPATHHSELTARIEIEASHEGDIDTGFLHPLITDSGQGAGPNINGNQSHATLGTTNAIPSHLLQIFLETFFNSCYAFCPILDRHSALEELKTSPLMANALAALGTNVQPPMVPCDSPATYYNRARTMFYEDEESSTLACLRAVLLFYWWAPKSTSTVHRHSSWWWTSVVIRQCQQMNLHRWSKSLLETDSAQRGLRKRIWWTAFARERLTALCQSKPAIIEPADCTIPEPALEDFPQYMQDTVKAHCFIHWVRLCGIIGRIAQHLSRGSTAGMGAPLGFALDVSSQSPQHELLSWVRDLPPNLQLGIHDEYMMGYDKDICQLYLPYLTAVIVLDLQRAPMSRSTPQAGPAAIIAASCMARIFRDILARGDTRFLQAITSWYCGVSFLALLSASKRSYLADAANADIEVIRLMCDQLGQTWGSAIVVYHGIRKLREASQHEEATEPFVAMPNTPFSPTTTFGRRHSTTTRNDEPSWMQYFPFATPQTSELVRILLERGEQHDTTSFEAGLFYNNPDTDVYDIFLHGLEDTDFSNILPEF